MSGTPAATVTTSSTGSDWSKYTDTATAISIPSGNHEIYLKFVADDSKAVCNLDWFQFEYEPETVKDSGDIHEAENAHGFVDVYKRQIIIYEMHIKKRIIFCVFHILTPKLIYSKRMKIAFA